MLASHHPANPHQTQTFLELGLESKLQEMPLYAAQIEVDSLGKDVNQILDNDPLLPGVILIEQGALVGAVSRRKFLEEMSRPYGLDLFLNRPLKVLYGFVGTEVLLFPGDTHIVTAAQQALQRSPKLLYEPIVVELEPQVYRLLDFHQLLVAQSQIHLIARRLLHEQSQAHMIQTEKMASLGRIVASVAHEILNPVNFISGNLKYLSSYAQDLTRLLSEYEVEIPQAPKGIVELKEAIDFEFLLQDLPRIIDSMRVGADRLKEIVGSLRNFSHVNEAHRKLANLHECLDNTLLILNSQIKSGITVVKNYGEIPLVGCYSGQLSQVFMNIISNAIDALLEKSALYKTQKSDLLLEEFENQEWMPQISITTEFRSAASNSASEADDWISVRIADNGPGIPLEVQNHIFETFFTTKPVGAGTGLGLAISYQIVVEKHGGKIHLNSQPEMGTEFEILLPLQAPQPNKLETHRGLPMTSPHP